MSSEAEKLFGKTRRWKEGDILFAENEWLIGAFVVTTDPEKLSGFRMGLHPHGDGQICVEYLAPDQAKAWEQT